MAQQHRAAVRRKRRPKWFLIVPALVVAVGLLGWGTFALISQLTSRDFEGSGGAEVVVTIRSGDTACGGINTTLESQGVIKDAQFFCDLVLEQETEPVFQVGSFRLKEGMSSQAALDAILNPKNKVDLSATIIEGWTAQQAFEKVSDVTGIPLEEFESAAQDFASFGVPADAPSIEGFLFPATYEFEPDQNARQIIQIMVDRMMESLDSHQVPIEDRLRIVTMASIIQREAGSVEEDFYRVSRVFWNRLDQTIWPSGLLQSDATVSYGTGNTHTVWTKPEERADKSNLYNTYAIPGLPVGPISLPGDLAIDAAMNPASGSWLFFVPINLATGETVFSETQAQHDAARKVLAEWCKASDARGESYCD